MASLEMSFLTLVGVDIVDNYPYLSIAEYDHCNNRW